MIDFEALSAAMGELDEDTVKEILESVDNGDDAAAAMEACQKSKDRLNSAQKELKALFGYLKIKGEGEITAQKKVFPNTRLELRNERLEIRRETLSASFYFLNGEIKEI